MSSIKKRADLLQELKVGDKVRITGYGTTVGCKWVTKVERFTPTLVVMANGMRFRLRDGRAYGTSDLDYKEVTEILSGPER
jgi:hypothetical protein